MAISNVQILKFLKHAMFKWFLTIFLLGAPVPCSAGSTVVRLQHDTSTTWFQTSNLIQSNRAAVADNKTQK